EAGDQAREESVDGVARPRHRQGRQRGVLWAGGRFSAEDLRHANGVGVGGHGAFGVGGGSGGVGEDGGVVPLAPGGLRAPNSRGGPSRTSVPPPARRSRTEASRADSG